MAKYKIEFSGFAYVEADSKEAAHDAWSNDECSYSESEVDAILTVRDFEVEV